ncbi:MAG: DUF4416 family protein [candidate division WOR-3 bacterium]|jgi:hypothetical protein
MGDVKKPQPVMPVIGLIFVPDLPVDIFRDLREDFGNAVLKSDTLKFNHTTYYNDEMGSDLVRQWCAFDRLVSPDILARLKIMTNAIEMKYRNEKGGRRVNIDPGLLSLSSLILASTKNYAHRIYLGQGVYAEITLIYKNHKFNALDWTYPDYQEDSALEFFQRARAILQEQLTASDSATRE